MKERPIIFNNDMIKAILNGQKTQTRRPVKPPFEIHRQGSLVTLTHVNRHDDRFCPYPCPFGEPGDYLWVRETWGEGWTYGGGNPCVFYRADGSGLIGSKNFPVGDRQKNYKYGSGLCDSAAPHKMKWRPSIHMPRWASRLTLEITDVRLEYVQDITEENARSEGCYWSDGEPRTLLGATTLIISAKDEFQRLWDSIYGESEYAWKDNPLVWVLSFQPTFSFKP